MTVHHIHLSGREDHLVVVECTCGFVLHSGAPSFSWIELSRIRSRHLFEALDGKNWGKRA